MDRRTAAAAYGDYDNDGWLDLYVATHHYPFNKPQGDAHDDPTHADSLYHNVAGANGNRAFVDVAPIIFDTTSLNLAMAHSTGFVDYDNDRDLDILVVNECFECFPTNPYRFGMQMWRNDGPETSGNWIFTDVTLQSGVSWFYHPMGLAIGDYNNDGWLDMACSDLGANRLYLNQADGRYKDVALEAGVARQYLPDGSGEAQFGWGLIFFDYDLDGFEDLYVSTGQSAEPGKQYNPLFHNLGNGKFEDVTDVSGADLRSSCRAVTMGDYDRDGDVDFYVVTYGHDAHLYRNEQSGGSWLAMDLVGTVSNRDAIGARVKVTANGIAPQYRMVQSGSTTNGGHELTLHFGVTGVSQVDTIEIDWPSGLTTLLEDVAVNQRLTIQETIPVPTSITITGSAIVPSNDISVFTAGAIYDDGTTVNITEEALWSVAPTTYCEFLSPGQMRTFGMSPGQTEAVVVMAEYGGLESTLPVDIVDPTEVDIEAPAVDIVLDAGGNSVTTDVNPFVLTGSATDNFAIVSLYWASNQGPQGPCAGLNPWSTGPITLFEGANLITVTGTDAAGNMGNSQVTVTYVPFMLPVENDNDAGIDNVYSSDENDNESVVHNDNDNDNSVSPPPSVNDNVVEPPVVINENTITSDNIADPNPPRRNTVAAPACGGFGWITLTWLAMGLTVLNRCGRPLN